MSMPNTLKQLVSETRARELYSSAIITIPRRESIKRYDPEGDQETHYTPIVYIPTPHVSRCGFARKEAPPCKLQIWANTTRWQINVMPVSPGRSRAEDDHEREGSLPAGSAGRLIPLKLFQRPAGLSLTVGWVCETFAWRNYRIRAHRI